MRIGIMLLLMVAFSTVNASHHEKEVPAADRAVLSQIAPGQSAYGDVVKLLGPPNEVQKRDDGAQLLIYSGNRKAIKQHVGVLFFGWSKETPGDAYRTVIAVKDGMVESVTSN